ncbi:hypothetical protein ACSSS7_006105 [Eimeria intestinalis]
MREREEGAHRLEGLRGGAPQGRPWGPLLHHIGALYRQPPSSRHEARVTAEQQQQHEEQQQQQREQQQI